MTQRCLQKASAHLLQASTTPSSTMVFFPQIFLQSPSTFQTKNKFYQLYCFHLFCDFFSLYFCNLLPPFEDKSTNSIRQLYCFNLLISFNFISCIILINQIYFYQSYCLTGVVSNSFFSMGLKNILRISLRREVMKSKNF